MDALPEDGDCRKTEEGPGDVHRLWPCVNLKCGGEA
jgi:hypothetical protein